MDEQTYIALVPTVRHVVLREAARYLPGEDDAADVAQEVMLKLWQLRGTLSDNKNMLYAYATVLSRNLCLNMLRSMAVRRTERLEEEMEVVSTDNAQHSMERQEQALRIRAVWNDLPQQHRIIIHMKEVDRLTTREIAALLGTTECNVRTRLSRARKAFIERMGHS